MTNDRTPVALDTETHLFAPGNMAPKVVCVSTAGDPATAPLYLAPDAVQPVRSLLEKAKSMELVVVGQNTAYDTACLLAHHGRELGPAIWEAYAAGGIHCTRVRERLFDIRAGSRYTEEADGSVARKAYSLAALAKDRLGIELDKTTYRTNYATLEGIPLDQWAAGERDYAILDAVAALGVWRSQEDDVRAYTDPYDSWGAESGRQAAYGFCLQLMKCWGMGVDQTRVAAMQAEVMPQMQTRRQQLVALGIMKEVKGKTSKNMDAIRTLVGQTWQGEGNVPTTDKGAVRTAAEVLEHCNAPGLQTLVEFTELEKLSSNVLVNLAAVGAQPVHADYDVLGADTGRTSCRGAPVQRMPRAAGVRECFKAREGTVLVACDFDSQELRTLAQVLQDLFGRSTLADRYQADPDYDPHTDFASSLLGISYQEAMARKKAKNPELLERRQQSKAANFGFPGGMGATKFQAYARGYGLSLSLPEAEGLREQWFRQMPEMRDYFNLITNRIDSGLTTITQLRSGRQRGNCGFTDGCNTYFQGLAADVSKNALWEVTRRCYGAPGYESSPLAGCRPVVFIHDEIIMEAPVAYAHEAAVEMERVMCAAMEELTPDVPARASPALMRNWTKKADAVFDADGRYICWEDQQERGGE